MARPHSRLGDQLAREVGPAVAAAIKECAVIPQPLHVNPANKRDGEADSHCNMISNWKQVGVS